MGDPQRTFRFRNFTLYKDARELNREMKALIAKRFPRNEVFRLRAQLWRALDSVILNIAEGSDRGTDKDFAHFLNIARGSLCEVVASLDIASDQRYLSPEEHRAWLCRAAMLADQLSAFRRSLLMAPMK